MKLVTNGRLITRNADAQGDYEHVVTPCLIESM